MGRGLIVATGYMKTSDESCDAIVLASIRAHCDISGGWSIPVACRIVPRNSVFVPAGGVWRVPRRGGDGDVGMAWSWHARRPESPVASLCL